MNEEEAVTQTSNLGDGGFVDSNGLRTRSQTRTVPDPQKSVQADELQHVVTRVYVRRTDDDLVAPPPDGGIDAWLQVLIIPHSIIFLVPYPYQQILTFSNHKLTKCLKSHLINFNAFGYTSSFGIFQAYYTEHYHYSASAVAWIGTINLCLIYLVGIFSGRAMDAGHFRTCTAVGLSMQLIGIFATSISTQYWQLVLSQGVCQGVANGLLFCPAVANVATYFSPKRRALAVSCVACGGATGGMVFPAIAKSFLVRIGFGWTLRVMGFVMLFNAVLIAAVSRTRLLPKASAPFLDRTAFQEPAFALHCVGVFLVFWAIWIAYFFIRSFAIDMLGASQAISFDLLLEINGVGLPGRLIPALISDRYLGPVNTLLASSVAAAVLLFCWIAVNSIGALFVWDAMYGFFAGSIQALTLASASSFAPDMSNVGSRVGLTFVVLGISSLTGPAIGGALIAAHRHSYLPAQLFAGVAMTAGCFVLALARIAQTGPHLRSRV